MSITPKASFPDLRLSVVSTHQGRSLPRWSAEGAVYHVAFHLADSVPQSELVIWRELRFELKGRAKDSKRPLSVEEVQLLKACYDERVERFLASGCGECLLKTESASRAIADVLQHDNGLKYALHVYCVMPNHLHVIVGGFASRNLMAEVVQTWKSVMAHKLNALLDRKGPVWTKDSYTRIIRDSNEYHKQLSYVWNNPESANLAAGFRRERFVTW